MDLWPEAYIRSIAMNFPVADGVHGGVKKHRNIRLCEAQIQAAFFDVIA